MVRRNSIKDESRALYVAINKRNEYKLRARILTQEKIMSTPAWTTNYWPKLLIKLLRVTIDLKHKF